MNPLALALATVAAAAAAGFGIGEVMRRNLNRLNYRLDTERDQPEPSQRHWVPWITAAATGLLSIAAIYTPQPWLILPLLPLALTGAWLSAVDLDVYRLPNRVTGPIAAATAAGVAASSLATHNPSVAIASLIGGITAGGIFLLSHLITSGGIGFGDVKLAAIAGLALGPHGIGPVTLGLIIGSIAAITWAKATHHTGAIAYGPWLLLGTGAAILATNAGI